MKLAALERRSPERAGLRMAFSFLFWEASFAFVYETWIGPTYLSGMAGELGLSVSRVSLLTSMAWIGAAGQWIGARFTPLSGSVKRRTLILATTARSLWLLPLAFALAGRTAEDFFPVLLAAALGAALIGSTSAMGWMSWMQALIPENFQGRFFGVRQRYMMGGVITANLIGTALVGFRPGGTFAGFALLGALAVLAGIASSALLAKVPAPETLQLAHAHWLEPFKNARFRKLLLFGAAFTSAIMLASPYFPYYFTKELQVPMSWVTVWSLLTNIAMFSSSGIWGRRLDRIGNASRNVWWIGHLIALSPLFYVFSRSATLWIAPFEFFENGLIWAGFNLSMTSLLMRSCPREKSFYYFSTYTAVCGLSNALAVFLGGKLVILLGSFRALWVAASVARLAMLYLFGRL